ncbi:MAG: hypothetical protein QM756_09575 [Polyangiaceae bacterium]
MRATSPSSAFRLRRGVSLALLCATALASACGADSPAPSEAPHSGGASSGGAGSSLGGAPGSSGSSSSGGTSASGGSTSGASGFGGTATGGTATGGAGFGGTATGGTAPANFSLVVDSPKSGATVQGLVTVSGWAPGFKNVEAWDSTHQSPPLGRATPAADGTFSFSVDASKLSVGSTQWTIWAWDTAAGVPATRSASVPLNLTIAAPQQGSGGSTASGGTTASGGRASSGGVSASGGVNATGGGGASGGSGSSGETVGTGSIDAPAIGPGPTEATKVGGATFTLVKNWNFGSNGTLRNISELSSEFMYHDQFGTIGNGSNYGAITVAPNSATAIQGQPVEDAARPYREFSTDSMKAYVRPLSASQSNVSVSAHNAGNGSITAKWTLASGGKLLGKDLLWETRARMPVAAAAYWFAIWTAGNKWDGGAEMDVLESFGTPNIYPPPAAFHVNSVGGRDNIDYSSWPNGLSTAGVPSAERDLRNWHVWTWLYRKDDTYTVYYDGHVVQSGTLIWTLGGTTAGEHINMSFLFDFGWGHTKISDVNITLPAADFNITYEVDYSRVYLR